MRPSSAPKSAITVARFAFIGDRLMAVDPQVHVALQSVLRIIGGLAWVGERETG